MARVLCVVALLAGLVAAPGCNCMGGSNCSSSRRPSFMEFGGCLGGCGSSSAPIYAAPMAAPCSAPGCGGGCESCGGAAAAPCCNDGGMVH